MLGIFYRALLIPGIEQELYSHPQRSSQSQKCFISLPQGTSFRNFALEKDVSLTGGAESPGLALGLAEGPGYVKVCPCCA